MVVVSEAMVDVGGEQAIRWLREQDGLCERLELLQQVHRPLLSGQDVRLLLTALEDRQRLTDRIVQIGHLLAPVRQCWASFREKLSGSERLEADTLIARTNNRLGRLMESDARDMDLLSRRRAVVSFELRDTQATTRALQAYQVTTGAGLTGTTQELQA